MKRSVTPSLLESPLVTFMSAHTHPAELAKARTKSVAVVRKISTRLPEQRGPGAGGDDDSEGANDEPRPFGGPGFDYESFGGAEGIRTPDPLDANEVRYRTAPQPPGNRSRITAGVSRLRIREGRSVADGAALLGQLLRFVGLPFRSRLGLREGDGAGRVQASRRPCPRFGEVDRAGRLRRSDSLRDIRRQRHRHRLPAIRIDLGHRLRLVEHGDAGPYVLVSLWRGPPCRPALRD